MATGLLAVNKLHASSLVVAIAAVNRTIHGRTERNFRFLTTISAYCFEHLAGLAAIHAGFASCTASRATARLIRETFFCEKFLLRSGEDEFCAAITASKSLVFHYKIPPQIYYPLEFWPATVDFPYHWNSLRRSKKHSHTEFVGL